MQIDHFKEHFQTIIDQRQGAKVTYCLFEVLFGSLCAVIAGAKGWFDIREYIRGLHDWFKRNNVFLNGIPVDDTIARIISTIEPEQFHECSLANWRPVAECFALLLSIWQRKARRSRHKI